MRLKKFFPLSKIQRELHLVGDHQTLRICLVILCLEVEENEGSSVDRERGREQVEQQRPEVYDLHQKTKLSTQAKLHYLGKAFSKKLPCFDVQAK